MELEPLLEPRSIRLARALDVDPPQPLGLDDLDVRLLWLRRSGYDETAGTRRSAKAWLGQAWHRDFAARRSSSLTLHVRLYRRVGAIQLVCSSVFAPAAVVPAVRADKVPPARHSWTH